MKKRTKILSAVGVVILLAVCGVVWNANSIVRKFRPDIEGILSKAVQRDVAIGDISVRFFPGLAVQIENISLGSQLGSHASQPILKKLYLDTALSDLLQGKVNVSTLVLEGLDAEVIRGKDQNITIAGIPFSQANETPSASTAKDSGAVKIELKNVTLKNGKISWKDETHSQPVEVSFNNIQATITDIDFSGQAKLRLKGNLLSTDQENIELEGDFANPFTSALKGSLSVRALDLANASKLLESYGVSLGQLKLDHAASFTVGLSAAQGAFSVETSLDATPANVSFVEYLNKKAGEPFKISVRGDYLWLTETFQAKEAQFQLGPVKLEFPLTVKPNGALSGDLTVHEFNVKDLSSTVPFLASYELSGDLSGKVHLVTERDQKQAKLNGEIHLNQLTASIPVGNQQSGDTPKTLKVSNATGSLSFKEDSVTIKKFSLQIEQQPLEISLKATPLTAPTIGFLMNSPELHLGTFLAPLSKLPSGFENSTIKDTQLQGTYSLLTENGSLALSLAGAQFGDIVLAKANIKTEISPSTLTLEPSDLGIFNGRLRLQGSLARDTGQALQLALQGGGLDASQISRLALSGSSISVRGTIADVGLTLSGSMNNLSSSASGQMKLLLENGAIVGVNVLKETLGKVNNIPGLGAAMVSYVPPSAQPVLTADETPFDLVQAAGSITHGTLHLSNFSLKHSLYLITGSGSIAPNGDMKLNTQLRLTPLLAKDMVLKQPQLKLLMDREQNITIPVVISRNNGSTLVLPDASQLLKNAAGNTAKETATRALEKVAPGLGEAGKVLDSLF